MIVVADAGPLHYLILIGLVDGLPLLFDKVAVPQAVQEELVHPRAPISVRNWMHTLPSWLKVYENSSEVDRSLNELDIGEQQAISLARQIQCRYLLIDDLAGRTIAESQQLSVIGTIGILKQAASAGLLNFPAAISKLEQTNFRISRSLRHMILEDQANND